MLLFLCIFMFYCSDKGSQLDCLSLRCSTKPQKKALLHHMSINLLMCVAVISLQNKTSIFGKKLTLITQQVENTDCILLSTTVL